LKNTVSYDKKGFIIDGKREFLIGGEFHYFRVPSILWEDRLKKMKSTGANLISVYIAWNMHEPLEGVEVWDGDYDLNRFLGLCQKYGFYVLIKPGPYICAELDFGGHPDWLIEKIARKEFRLRMLDEGYLEQCRKWYKRVSEVINPHLHINGGAIIAAQIENEYDHLIEYGEETITVEDAVNYLMTLKSIMEDYHIDVPKFANEAAFLRGKGVIDTRTYYPNIPGLWMWEFDSFEGKIIDSKKSQTDSPVMILELQAGWFSQIGAPTYEPDLSVVEGVSKSVLIQGASIINYYMMVGGTTFPFIGARGDVFFLGGLGNITSYDFGGSPVRESGELHKDKYYWIKGFIRFSKEFSDIILSSDGKRYINVISGGEDVALLTSDGAIPDYSVDKCNENFTVYEEGNEAGRFFFIRNLEDVRKDLTLSIPCELIGKGDITFKASVKAKETKMLPITFKIPDSEVVINYSTSEILMSSKYDKDRAFIMYGKPGTTGELCINQKKENISIAAGDVNVLDSDFGCILQYKHNGIIIVKIQNVTLFIIEETMIGGIEELPNGLLFNNFYYVEEVKANGSTEMDLLLLENSKNKLQFYPMGVEANVNYIMLDDQKYSLVKDAKTGMYTGTFDIGTYGNRPELEWTSDWSYSPDTEEISINYDYSSWTKLEKPISLEEAGFIEHGYYWYKTEFELSSDPGMIFMDYIHNDTDRMFIYINENLVYKSHNKQIKMKDISKVLKLGKNDMTILYANEFHNKSHPHEGALVKFSGIMNPFILHGTYSDGSACNVSIKEFYLKQGLTGINSGFHTSEYSDSNWVSTPESRKYVTSKEMGHIVWFRRKFRYDISEEFNAPIQFITKEADQRLTIYVNGHAVARYDILGPQQEFYIPESFLKNGEDNVLSIILECPAFYDELQSGYRRGYMHNPQIETIFVAKKAKLQIK